MKTCSKCKETKPLEDFITYKRKEEIKHGICKACHNRWQNAWNDKNRERYREIARDSYARKGRDKELKQTYGITEAEYELLFESQKGLCALCLNPSKKRLQVDHCHTTGKVRGLLCRACNLGLGFFRDNKFTLLRAIDYITL